MKIGYACINRTVGCQANNTFRLASYSKKRLIEAVAANLDCLSKILEWNVGHNLFLFRISSQIVPFASHPICKFAWQDYFRDHFATTGKFIQKHGIRISMHPGQFTIINSPNKRIVARATKELQYHAEVLDLLNLKVNAKIQIHGGGVYNDKAQSIKRFAENYHKLPQIIKRRLVIENDERSFALADCLKIHTATKIPIVCDTFHHECFNYDESIATAIKQAAKTWRKRDGTPIIDYSSQAPDKRTGAHTEHLNPKHFRRFLTILEKIPNKPDIMLEIKDKERSALKVLQLLSQQDL